MNEQHKNNQTKLEKSEKLNGLFKFKHLRSLVFIVVFVLVGTITILQTHSAPKGPQNTGTARLFLSPAKQTSLVGDILTITVNEDSLNKQINAVQANLSYDPNALEFVSFDNTSSAFDLEAQSVVNNGQVTIARAHVSSLTGQWQVTKVSFKVLKKFNRSTVDFVSGSAIVNSTDNTNILGSSVGGIYSTR